MPGTRFMNSAGVETLEQKVSERISRIGDFVIDGRPTWDICCDHGQIGLWAYRTHRLPELHFVDRAPHITADLERALSPHMDLTSIYFHSMDAAALQLPPTPCNVIVAGVGFKSMRRIVGTLYPVTRPHRVIISVHSEEERVDAYMRDQGWSPTHATSVEERGRTRAIRVWDG
jgi:tRNA (adenine22-N1)-methyltransferase